MKKTFKNSALVVGISALYIIVINVFAFVLIDNYGKNFWCGYICITLSWICLVINAIMATRKNDGGRSLFLNAPGVIISVIHLLVQSVLGIIIMAVPSFSIKAAVCLEVLLYAIYLFIIGMLQIYIRKNY